MPSSPSLPAWASCPLPAVIRAIAAALVACRVCGTSEALGICPLNSDQSSHGVRTLQEGGLWIFLQPAHWCSVRTYSSS